MRATTSLTPTPYGSLLQTVSQISFQKLLINRLHEFPHLKTETSVMSNDCCIKDLRDEQHSEEYVPHGKLHTSVSYYDYFCQALL